jgi:5-oxoprolinase (ATP-hydrolysing) subunit A
MWRTIDINCDMGEGMGNDEALMPYITSANIACGFHAGNGETIRRTIDLAKLYNVRIGAHPSFRDKDFFGRRELDIPGDKLYAIVIEQIIKMDMIAREKGVKLYHVKPHGALYNMAARDPKIARIIAQTVKDFDDSLVIYGLSGSHLVKETQAMGLVAVNEAFADRTYRDDGSLTPRSQPNAIIINETESLQQVMQIMEQGTVTTVSGKVIPMQAETICIHGDEKTAVGIARTISNALHRKMMNR